MNPSLSSAHPPRPFSHLRPLTNSRSFSPSPSYTGEFRQRAVSSIGPEDRSPSRQSPPVLAEPVQYSPSPFSAAHPSPSNPQDTTAGEHSQLRPEIHQLRPSYHLPKRVCLTCGDDAPSGWRRSVDHPGSTVSKVSLKRHSGLVSAAFYQTPLYFILK